MALSGELALIEAMGLS